jgi:hypothetical protein
MVYSESGTDDGVKAKVRSLPDAAARGTEAAVTTVDLDVPAFATSRFVPVHPVRS